MNFEGPSGRTDELLSEVRYELMFLNTQLGMVVDLLARIAPQKQRDPEGAAPQPQVVTAGDVVADQEATFHRDARRSI